MNDAREGLDSAGARALSGGVTLARAGRVATVQLNRPAVRNAMTFATWAGLAEAAEHLAANDSDACADDQLQVVLLRSTGPDFSAGLDLRMMQPGGLGVEGDLAQLLSGDDHAVAERIVVFQRAFTCWARLDAIVIAVVQGRAIGAGFQLALATDLRVLAADASLRMAEVGLGLVPDLGGTSALARLLGPAGALDLCASGRPVTAAEARLRGLADRVAPPGELDDEVARLVSELTARSMSATRAIKRLIADAAGRDQDAQLAAERTAQVALLRRLAAQRQR